MVATLVVYGPVAGHDFVAFDDPKYILDNVVVTQGLSWEGARWAFTNSYAATWHPLTWLSHMLDCELFGLNASGHHLVNVALHAVNAVLLFSVLRLTTGACWPSAFVAALFAVHPLRVESVAWASERKDVLAGLFWMLTILAYRRYVRRPGIASYLAVALALAFGLMAKPMLVTLPLVLLLLDVWPLGRWRPLGSVSLQPGECSLRAPNEPLPRLLLEKVPLLALSVAASLVAIITQTRALRSFESVSLADRVSNSLLAYVLYLWKTIWPTDLAVLYPHPALVASPGALAASSVFVVAAALFLVAATALALVSLRRRPWVAVGWLWYLGTLVPVIGIVQVGGHAWADRYAYLPLIGVYVAIAWSARDALARWPRARSVVAVVACTLLVACMARARNQVGYWQNSFRLFEHALEVTDSNWGVHYNLGMFLSKRGDLESAVDHYKSAIRIKPDLAVAHQALGVAISALGRRGEAMSHWERAVEIDPDLADAHSHLGAAYLKLGDLDRAIARFERVARLRPDRADSHYNLGLAYQTRGRDEDAVAAYRRALEIEPSAFDSGRKLAWILATSRDPSVRDGQDALRLAEQCLRAGGYRHADCFEAMAAAYAESGDFERAIEWQEMVVKSGTPEHLAEPRARLELYRAGTPYRTSELP